MHRLLPVLIALAAVSTATAAQAARGPTTTLHVTSYSVLYGHTVTIGGRISNHRAGAHVVLLAQRYGHAHATRAATLTTRVGGYWRFRAGPPIQTDYRARVGANLGQPVRVGVAPVVSVRELPNGRLAVRVTAARSFNGRKVKLQRRTGGAWHTISQHELGLHSAAVIKPNLPASFVRIAMSVNQAGVGYLGSASHVLHYRPLRVTLLTSSFKTRFGNTITLHGRVTSGLAGARVAVFARRYGRSAPHRVTTVRTGPGGTWHLVVKPSLQTAYFARSGPAASRHLTVGVRPLITVSKRPGGRVTAHVMAGVSLVGRNVKLQSRVRNGWQTVMQRPLNRGSRTTFVVTNPAGRLRVALSVNQAGAGLLGSLSKPLVYHTA